VSDTATLTSGVAGRYATALFDLALEADSLDATDADLQALREAIAGSEDLQDLINSPIHSRTEQAAGVAAVAGAMGLSQLTRNVLGLMADRRRLFVVPQVIAIFSDLLAEHRGEVTADVTAAHALSDAQRDALRARLSDSTERDVKLNVTVDPKIIGGLIVKMGSRMIDTSIRTKLNGLQNAMKEVG
jgi:F-type H+-transporting ATPase subunit delta